MKPLERSYDLDIWDDTKIRPGSPWNEEIRQAVGAAKIAILLVSADFLASEFIAAKELPPLLSAARDEGAVILPIIISPSRFLKTKSLAEFQAVNDPAMPLIDMSEVQREDVFVKVVDFIEESLSSSRESNLSPSPEALQSMLPASALDGIARRVVELLSDKAVRDIVWEIVPDLAEVIIHNAVQEVLKLDEIKERIHERVSFLVEQKAREVARDLEVNNVK